MNVDATTLVYKLVGLVDSLYLAQWDEDFTRSRLLSKEEGLMTSQTLLLVQSLRDKLIATEEVKVPGCTLDV